jgi:hypothetical protein
MVGYGRWNGRMLIALVVGRHEPVCVLNADVVLRLWRSHLNRGIQTHACASLRRHAGAGNADLPPPVYIIEAAAERIHWRNPQNAAVAATKGFGGLYRAERIAV